jgi:hypothetical protein
VRGRGVSRWSLRSGKEKGPHLSPAALKSWVN